jgi:ABC-type multidrug transport system ATPase subunit
VTPVITAEGLTKKYGDRTVVRALSLSVDAGTVFGFLGPNGSGKSTTIKMLCGLVRPTSGTGSVAGFDIEREDDGVRRSIGYVSQSFALYEELTVEQNLEFYGRAYGLEPARRAQRKLAVIELTGLSRYADTLAGNLSGGWKQRLALASALLHEPRVLFLDEPTAGIDPVARRELWDLLFKLASDGATLFVTTHYMDEAERCTRLGYIYDGDLIALGTLAELRVLPGVAQPGTTRFRVGTENVMAAFARARRLEYVRDATIFGRDLHIVAAAGVDEARLRADLTPAAGRIDGVEEIEPSLEDVFVALTREHGAA